MDIQPEKTLTSIWEKSKILFKSLVIGILILVMLIPIALLSELVAEREARQQQVVSEISSKWASQQTIKGPVLIVPYILKTDSLKYVKKNLCLLPDRLTVNGKLLPEVRHRSLYEVVLYRSALSLEGVFDPAAIKKTGVAPENILWNEASFVLGLDDARGLEDEVKLQWDTAATKLEASIPENNVIANGLSTPVQLTADKSMAFNIQLKLKGSTYLYFTPVGKTTEINLTSTWKDPAFDGQYLPSQPADISDSGFAANWKILQVSRSYPQAWKDAAQHDLSASAFGVKLLQPTDGYAKTSRSVKYALMVVALTFTIFFFMEIFRKKQVHPLQYILVGVALCVFYSLLLSISEYTSFNAAYSIAAIATVLLVGLYVQGIFKRVQVAAGFTAALAALYTYIFILIQLQDYALLFGSIGLFLILAVIMYFSRKIDWYGTGQQHIKE